MRTYKRTHADMERACSKSLNPPKPSKESETESSLSKSEVNADTRDQCDRPCDKHFGRDLSNAFENKNKNKNKTKQKKHANGESCVQQL